MTIPPSGEQFEIRAGGQRATIVEVGGGLREYEVESRPVLEPYPLDRMRDGAHGAPLVPWPNRLAGGRYSFDGEDHQLAITEPERQNAIHGLLLWRPWRAVERAGERIVMGTRLHPLPGYPFTLDLEIAYELSDHGLSVATTARNAGDRACPYGHGQHPYLSPAQGLIDDCSVQLEAGTRILTDPERQLPAGSEPVRGTPFDFGELRTLGDTPIDHPFTDLARPFVQLYTGDSLKPDRARRGLAAEPMTCPTNAFATGESLIRLEPGESVVSTWGARLS